MLPRYDILKTHPRKPPDFSCSGLERRVVEYQTGYRKILTGIMLLLGLAAYSPDAGPVSLPDNPVPEKKIESPSQEIETEIPEPLYARHAESAGSRHKIDPLLISAVIEVESRGNPHAVSPRGAKGLMQIMPVICKKYGVIDPFDMEQNVNAGAAHLASLLEALNGDLERALAAYNCGLGTVLMHGRIPPIGETRKFVRRTLARYKIFLLGLEGQPG